MKKLYLFLVPLIALSIAFTASDGVAGCFRMLNIDASTAASDTLKVSGFSGSAEVAFLLHVASYTHSGTAAGVYFYTEIQGKLYPLRVTHEATGAAFVPISDGYFRGTVSLYAGSTNPVTGNKVYGEKLRVAYIANDSTAGDIILDVCVRND